MSLLTRIRPGPSVLHICIFIAFFGFFWFFVYLDLSSLSMVRCCDCSVSAGSRCLSCVCVLAGRKCVGCSLFSRGFCENEFGAEAALKEGRFFCPVLGCKFGRGGTAVVASQNDKMRAHINDKHPRARLSEEWLAAHASRVCPCERRVTGWPSPVVSVVVRGRLRPSGVVFPPPSPTVCLGPLVLAFVAPSRLGLFSPLPLAFSALFPGRSWLVLLLLPVPWAPGCFRLCPFSLSCLFCLFWVSSPGFCPPLAPLPSGR